MKRSQHMVRFLCLRLFALAGCILLNACVSIQTKSGLPEEWQTAMQPSGSADISGEYTFRGEGELVPDNRITAFLPVSGYSPEGPFVFRQVSPKLVEVRLSGRTSSVMMAVDSDRETGEVTVPTFSKPDSSDVTSVKVVFIKGRDGALYAKRTNVSAGLGELLPVPAAGVLTRWCRFLPVRR